MKRVLIVSLLALVLVGCTPKEDPGIEATKNFNALQSQQKQTTQINDLQNQLNDLQKQQDVDASNARFKEAQRQNDEDYNNAQRQNEEDFKNAQIENQRNTDNMIRQNN